jgi:pimeloyl-ACP methyl ester carboxylesterase
MPNRRTIVFVHGAFCGGWVWERFREPFDEAGYAVRTPNLPCHEEGPNLTALAGAGVRDFAEALGRYIKAIPGPVVLVGHSLGGLIAQIAATHVRVDALILLAPSAPWGVMPTTMDEAAGQLGLASLGDYWQRAIEPDYAVARRMTLNRLPRDEARATFARFGPESGRAMQETIHWWSDPSMASAAPVFMISAPVLALSGEVDRINPPSTVRRIVARFPDAQADHQDFKGMSHWLLSEPGWENVAGALMTWLADRKLGPRRDEGGWHR